ncbi:hypothetical protein [Halorientalis salina]|uniref:hypothetical protein n=1 Tax=Halorientalis salina TaxID=2932266 RepID=UPI0010ABBEE5|nr:hypothetical protein [Halorientalis salina]
MAQTNDAPERNPLANPAVRHGLGFSGALVLVLVGYFFLEGTMQLLVYGMALLDVIVTPQILKLSVEQQRAAET